MKGMLNVAALAIASLAFVTAIGCFSYHKSEEVTKPATADQPTTTTTTTQSNDGTVRQHSTTTYIP